MTVTDSTIASNTASVNGGGVDSDGAVTVTGSTINGNAAGANGGGIFSSGVVTITNSTVASNTTTANGGGVFGADVTLVYATLVHNSGPDGANVTTLSLTSFGSVVVDPEGGGSGRNCSATSTTSNGFNFSDDASSAVSCMFNAATDHVGASNDAMLGALGANGGPTNTMVPKTGSPLIDAIPDPGGGCSAAPTITTDQRGDPRPSGVGCDIGAVEVQITAPAPGAVVAIPAFTG